MDTQADRVESPPQEAGDASGRFAEEHLETGEDTEEQFER